MQRERIEWKKHWYYWHDRPGQILGWGGSTVVRAWDSWAWGPRFDSGSTMHLLRDLQSFRLAYAAINALLLEWTSNTEKKRGLTSLAVFSAQWIRISKRVEFLSFFWKFSHLMKLTNKSSVSTLFCLVQGEPILSFRHFRFNSDKFIWASKQASNYISMAVISFSCLQKLAKI